MTTSERQSPNQNARGKWKIQGKMENPSCAFENRPLGIRTNNRLGK